MENATIKQLNYITTLKARLQEANILNIEIKEEPTKFDASLFIGRALKALKNVTTSPKIIEKDNISIAERLNNIDYDKLLKKYNAYSTDNKESNYNHIDGANCNSDLLNNTAKFKSFLNKLLKTEFDGLNFEIAASFKHYYNQHCTITLHGAKKDIYKSFEEIIAANQKYKLLECLFDRNFEYYPKNEDATKIFYNNYFQKTKQYAKYIDVTISEGYKKLVNFLTALLNSFSYDHSDIYTDYFDYGLQFEIKIEADESFKNDDEEYNSYNYFKNITANDLGKLYQDYQPAKLTEEETERVNKVIEEYKAKEEAEKIEAEQRKKEYEEEQKREAKIIEKVNNSVTIKNVNMILKNTYFPYLNKNRTLEQYTELGKDKSEQNTVCNIVKIIDFNNEEAFELFINNLLKHYNFLEFGGCGYYDNKVNKFLDYTKENYERFTNEFMEANDIFWAREAAIIRLNGENKFIVDPEGFQYARYVGFADSYEDLKDYTEPVQEIEANYIEILTKAESNLLEEIKSIENGSIIDFKSKDKYSDLFIKEASKIADLTFKSYGISWIKKGAAA